MSGNLYVLIEEALGVRAVSSRALSGGCVAEVYQVTLADGRETVVKVDRSAQPRLEVEGYMLEYLGAHSTLPVPAVYHSAAGLLIMERLPGTSSFDAGAEEHAAELLAELHGVRGDRFGLERHTLIGGLHQCNTQMDSWIAFFVEHRVMQMADAALRSRRMPHDVYKRLARFSERLPALLEEPAHPSLLHGDVWTTNVLAGAGQITGFIDPAIYYGHPEVELAFITLFNTFGSRFFERYAELRPIRDGFFTARRDLYNLYPLLVHTVLFGPSYLSGIDRVMTQHGF